MEAQVAGLIHLIRNIPNTNEQENSEKINELLISNVRLNDQIRD